LPETLQGSFSLSALRAVPNQLLKFEIVIHIHNTDTIMDRNISHSSCLIVNGQSFKSKSILCMYIVSKFIFTSIDVRKIESYFLVDISSSVPRHSYSTRVLPSDQFKWRKRIGISLSGTSNINIGSSCYPFSNRLPKRRCRPNSRNSELVGPPTKERFSLVTFRKQTWVNLV